VAARPDLGPKGWRATLGRKISVRYRLSGDPQHGHSEAVGVVSSVAGDSKDDIEVRLVTRRGLTVSFAARDVTHLKVFDPVTNPRDALGLSPRGLRRS
jgi:hypothetical protein